MSGAVQVEEADAAEWQATGTDGAPNLKQVAAERLAAHRNRRAGAAQQQAEAEARNRQHREALRQSLREDQRRGASMVKDAVMARYRQRESYREFLAAEAERAISQAQAEAEVAARSARAVAEAQMQLLEELDEFNQTQPGPREEAMAQANAETRGELAHALADIVMGARELMAEPSLGITEATPAPRISFAAAAAARAEPAVREISASGLTVRLFEDIPQPAPPERWESRTRREGSQAAEFDARDSYSADTLDALEDEIAFRRAPEFADIVLETVSIPGNLIEFPRELVAPRRARPRLAEGPLLDEPESEPQLRIFEVDAEQIAIEPADTEPAGAPGWQGLMLEGLSSAPALQPANPHAYITLPPQTASVERRLMSATVDLCVVTAAWLLAFAAAAQISGPALRSLSLPLGAMAAVGSLGAFAVLYQVLFFTVADSTPGMRFARISLCTFGDGNPTRRAMRRRVVSVLVAACPLGLGLAWTLLDNDRLGWHDRMSRMYQRAY